MSTYPGMEHPQQHPYAQQQPQQYAQPHPQTPAPERAVIANAGARVPLIDGEVVTLRYSMASLAMLEARFGSIKGISDEINKAQRALQSGDEGARGPIFTIVSDVIIPGLLHITVQHPERGTPVRLGRDRELAMEMLDPTQLQTYLDGFAGAFETAFGSVGKEQGPVATSTDPSLGQSGTTSQQSSPTDQTTSFGA